STDEPAIASCLPNVASTQQRRTRTCDRLLDRVEQPYERAVVLDRRFFYLQLLECCAGRFYEHVVLGKAGRHERVRARLGRLPVWHGADDPVRQLETSMR